MYLLPSVVCPRMLCGTKCCTADPGSMAHTVTVMVPVLRSSVKNAAPRPGHGALSESTSPPLDQLGADFLRLFLLGPMPAATDQIFLKVRHDLFHAVGRRRRQHRVVLGHDHQRG